MLDDNLHCLVKNIQKQNRRKQTKKEKKKHQILMKKIIEICI